MEFLSWYFACRTVERENTESSSSKVSALVSGSVNRTATHPTVKRDVTTGWFQKQSGEYILMHQAAYQLKAPWGLNALRSDGNEMASTKLRYPRSAAYLRFEGSSAHLNNQQTEVANDIPKSRIYKGNASAEYVKGTGPSPGE